MTHWPTTLHHHNKFDCRRSAAEEISSRWTFPGILNLFCDLYLDHNRAIQSFHKTIHLMMCHQTKFSCKRNSSPDNIQKIQILIILSVTVTLTLKIANQSFWKTIWLIMMQQKGSAIQKIKSGQTFIDILKFYCDLDLEHINPISL